MARAFDGLHQCDNCGTSWPSSDLRQVHEWQERVDLNGPVPSGECPKCGSLCYSVDDAAVLKSRHQQRIERFMWLADQPVPKKPAMPSPKVRLLRAKLILEEALETVKALGFRVGIIDTPLEGFFTGIEIGKLKLRSDFNPDLMEIVDGCCDLSVVTIGTLSACGVPDLQFLEEVDDNNLAKFGPGGHRREDGKWVKPPDHQPPQIQQLLDKLVGTKELQDDAEGDREG